MTLSELSELSQIVASLGVVVSLVFVGWQIRVSTKDSRLRMHEQVTQTYLSFLGSILVDTGTFAAGLKSEHPDFADLNDAQKAYFFPTMPGLFKHYEMMYVQYSQGVMDEETWDAWSTHIRMQFHQSGAQHWWNLRKEAFTPAFRAYLDASAEPAMRKFVDILQ